MKKKKEAIHYRHTHRCSTVFVLSLIVRYTLLKKQKGSETKKRFHYTQPTIPQLIVCMLFFF